MTHFDPPKIIERKCSKCDSVGKCSEGSSGPWLGNDDMCDNCGPCGNCGKQPSGPRAIRLGCKRLLKARVLYDNFVSEFPRGIPFDCDCINTFFDEDEFREELINVLGDANTDDHEKEVEQVCALYATYINYSKLLIFLEDEAEYNGYDDDYYGIPFFKQIQSKYSPDQGKNIKG